jgi:hypothetical protein
MFFFKLCLVWCVVWPARGQPCVCALKRREMLPFVFPIRGLCGCNVMDGRPQRPGRAATEQEEQD